MCCAGWGAVTSVAVGGVRLLVLRLVVLGHLILLPTVLPTLLMVLGYLVMLLALLLVVLGHLVLLSTLLGMMVATVSSIPIRLVLWVLVPALLLVLLVPLLLLDSMLVPHVVHCALMMGLVVMLPMCRLVMNGLMQRVPETVLRLLVAPDADLLLGSLLVPLLPHVLIRRCHLMHALLLLVVRQMVCLFRRDVLGTGVVWVNLVVDDLVGAVHLTLVLCGDGLLQRLLLLLICQ